MFISVFLSDIKFYSDIGLQQINWAQASEENVLFQFYQFNNHNVTLLSKQTSNKRIIKMWLSLNVSFVDIFYIWTCTFM